MLLRPGKYQWQVKRDQFGWEYLADKQGNLYWQTFTGDGYYRTMATSRPGNYIKATIYTMSGVQIGFLFRRLYNLGY